MPRRSAAFVIIGLVTALVLGGWLGRTTRGGTGEVTVAKTFPATVSFVNATHNAGCVQPDAGGSRICSSFAIVPGTSTDVGSKVQAAHEWYKRTGVDRTDVLLLYPLKR